MPRILLVKTSSLGDVVHNLPVASDIAAAMPGAQIDWVAEEALAALPQMHRHVARVIPAAVRRWRKSFWRSDTREEMRSFVNALRKTDYDAIVDTQGLFKSALIARAARGRRYGLDWRSSREPLFVFYHRTFRAPAEWHAVERNRSVASQALGYVADSRVDYGISAARPAFEWLSASRYAVLVHGTSAPRKLWPEARWIELARWLSSRALGVVLPWGSPAERDRSERIASAVATAVVPPRLAIAQVAGVPAGAALAIGVDTGLTHLAGALSIPTVGIYTATPPSRFGLYGCARAVNIGGPDGPPEVSDVIAAIEQVYG